MDSLKVVRSICMFTDTPSESAITRLYRLGDRLLQQGIVVQTLRMCSPDIETILDFDRRGNGKTLFSVGRLGWEQSLTLLDRLCDARNVNFNVEINDQIINSSHFEVLLGIIHRNAAKTFNFAYTFNNAMSSPFYPSAMYGRNGFAIGLQPTDLSTGCRTIEEWLHRLEAAWREIDQTVGDEDGYLGIDTSIAPLFNGPGSLIDFLKRIGVDFSQAVTTALFMGIADFIRTRHAARVGLCGLMFPCLEDFGLAAEYEKGNFTVERCLFLSLHCGLGLDAYPVGIDESPERIADVLKLEQGLSNKYRKPLSARFISDGVSKIGAKAHFQSPYLKDVTIRPL